MQRTFALIALALTLSTASAAFIQIQNYTKAPVSVAADSDTNFTNASSLSLGSINSGELDLIGSSYTLAPTPNASVQPNLSATNWVANFRKLDGKALTASTNTTASFTSNLGVMYSNGYAIAVSVDNDTFTNNVPQITVYQTKLSGGNTTRLNASSNTNSSYSPSFYTAGAIGKNIYIFYVTSFTGLQVNVTNFAIGATARGSSEFILTSSYGSGLQLTWGEALGSNQLYGNWIEGTGDARVFKYATIDVSKGSANVAQATAWVNTYTCTPFSTDKKYYGDLCFVANTTNSSNQVVNYYVRFNGTGLLPLNVSTNYNISRFNGVVPYGPYIAILYTDVTSSQNGTTYSYDIYNFDTWAITKPRTSFLIADGAYQVNFFRVVSGGLYTLINQQNAVVNATVSKYYGVQVGLVLGSSYLTSVLGFIMTIVAGVLLF